MWQDIIQFDRELLLSMNGHWSPFWDWFWYIVTTPWTWIPMHAAILWWAYRRWGWKQALFLALYVIIAIALADQVANIFKSCIPKFRPTHTAEIEAMVYTVNGYVGGLYGTVSGHAATSFAIATFHSLAFRRRWFTWCLYGWAILVAFSRIYLGVHFPMDILLGTITGLLIGWLCYRQYSKVKLPAK